MYGTYLQCASSTDWAHVASSTAEVQGRRNNAHLPHTGLTNFNPVKAASHSEAPECQIMQCQIMQNSIAFMMANLNILPTSL